MKFQFIQVYNFKMLFILIGRTNFEYNMYTNTLSLSVILIIGVIER